MALIEAWSEEEGDEDTSSFDMAMIEEEICDKDGWSRCGLRGRCGRGNVRECGFI
jgi:hypothetical protein